MSQKHNLTHKGIRYIIFEYDQYCHWDVKNKNGAHIQQQESNFAKANRKVKKYIDAHQSQLMP